MMSALDLRRTHRCDARLAQGLCCRSVHKLPRSADTNAAVGLERQEVLLTRDDDVSLRRQRHGQDEVIIGNGDTSLARRW